MKLTTESTGKIKGQEHYFRSKDVEIIKYFIDGVLIAKAKKYSDWFCTVRKGTPSNIRDKVKKCRDFKWEKEGLKQIIGHSDFTVGSRYTRSFNHINPNFIDDYPDTTWGYSGSIPSKKSIVELVILSKNKIVKS